MNTDKIYKNVVINNTLYINNKITLRDKVINPNPLYITNIENIELNFNELDTIYIEHNTDLFQIININSNNLLTSHYGKILIYNKTNDVLTYIFDEKFKMKSNNNIHYLEANTAYILQFIVGINHVYLQNITNSRDSGGMVLSAHTLEDFRDVNTRPPNSTSDYLIFKNGSFMWASNLFYEYQEQNEYDIFIVDTKNFIINSTSDFMLLNPTSTPSPSVTPSSTTTLTCTTTPSSTSTPSMSSTSTLTLTNTLTASLTPFAILYWSVELINKVITDNEYGLYGVPEVGDEFTRGGVLNSIEDYLNLNIRIPENENDFEGIKEWYDDVIDKGYSHEFIFQLIYSLKTAINTDISFVNLNPEQTLSLSLPNVENSLFDTISSTSTPTATPSATYPFFPQENIYVWTHHGVQIFDQTDKLGLYGFIKVNDIFTRGNTLSSVSEYQQLNAQLPQNPNDYPNKKLWYNTILKYNPSNEYIAQLIHILENNNTLLNVIDTFLDLGYIQQLSTPTPSYTQTLTSTTTKVQKWEK